MNGRPHAQRVFVVNGSLEFLGILREFLTEEGFEVETDLTAECRFERILEFRPDVLVIDIILFEDDSWKLLEQLNQNAVSHEMPVIIVSTMPHLIERAKELDGRYAGDYYLAKPLDLNELLRKIRAALSRTSEAD